MTLDGRRGVGRAVLVDDESIDRISHMIWKQCREP